MVPQEPPHASTTSSYRKIKVYAKANISEYWVIDVNQRQLLVFRQPQGDTYQIEQVLGVNDSIAPVAFPEVVIESSKSSRSQKRTARARCE